MEPFEPTITAAPWRWARTLGVAGGLTAAGLGWTMGGAALDVARGVRDLDGTPRWVDTRPAAPLRFEDGDLRPLYEGPLPLWGAAVGNMAADEPGYVEDESEAYGTLVQALEPFPSLQRLAHPLRIAARDPERHADALVDLMTRWNEATDREGVPVWVHHWVRSDGAFYVKTYEVIHDGTVEVGGRPYRARLVTRIDDLNMVSWWIGSVADQGGAVVIVDRLRTLVVDEVWPLLGPPAEAHPDRPALSRAFAPALREAVRRDLTPEQVEALARAAPHRERIERLVDVIRARGNRCSRFRVQRVRWYGFTPTDLDLLDGFAHRDRHLPCPSVTRDEVATLRSAFPQLVRDDEAVAATEALLAWSARAVLAHEARHAADDDRPGGITRWTTCEDCPVALAPVEIHEASAYASSFAQPSTGVLAVFQACLMIRDSGGSHARAAQAVLDAIQPGLCETGPPVDLAERAAEVELAWFGRRDTLYLEDALLPRLPLKSPP